VALELKVNTEAANRERSRHIAPGWPPVKLLHRLLACRLFTLWAAQRATMDGGWTGVPRNTLLRISLSISRGQHDLEFIEFIPFGFGPLSVRDGQKRLQALSR